MTNNLIEDLFSTLNFEKKQDIIKPKKLPENFFKKISEEIRKLKKQIEKSDPNSEETQKLKDNLNQIKILLREIMLIRLKKIIECIILQNKENIELIEEKDLEDEEKTIYKILNKAISVYIKDIIKNLLEGEYPNEDALLNILSDESIIKRKVKDKKIIIITAESLPKILAPGGKTYGPFHYNDIVILQNSIAEKLTKGKQSVAEEI
ncbi:hypothetical protein BA065_01100 [Nanoarchaeota archaeon NZ13-N]|uniref:DNA replication complex GINS family protein n=1 Tax=Candidatus Nanoclepta minutus TaxID=1940235 RepID=A0A397WQE7_9ARCH|nr:MAG: hypothetical protein BA065_01100 [Nanoarchaeota archaeon NZ13-N]RIB35313.1 MAG: hypothetical protein BXU00_02165 [Candidatus Nanoclepta minutus]